MPSRIAILPIAPQHAAAKLRAEAVLQDFLNSENYAILIGLVALDLAGAFAYQEWLSAPPEHIGNTFTVDTEDGDTIDYVLVDAEVEMET